MEQNRLSGFIGTFIFHGIILLCLLLLYFSSPKIPKSEGVLVNFGNIDEAEGLFEPGTGNSEIVLPEEPASPAPTESNPVTIPNPTSKPDSKQEKIITQNTERTTYVENSEKKAEENRKKQEEIRLQQEKQRQQAEVDRQRKEQEAQANQINSLAAGAFGSGTGQGSQGSSSGQGNQGSPFGNSSQGSNTGVGGFGDSPVYSLPKGRTLGADGLPRPTASIKEEGRIVVNITVDPKGNVISAEIGSGTNIADMAMRNAALTAARKAKFNSVNITNNQTGTITYRYSLK